MGAELRDAYRRLEEAVHAVGRLEGFDGVLTEWALVTSCQHFDEDGDGVTQVGLILPDGGGQTPHHRVMGLLDFMLTRLRAQAAQDDD